MDYEMQLQQDIDRLNNKIDMLKSELQKIDRDNEKYDFFIKEYKKKPIINKILDRKYYKYARSKTTQDMIQKRKTQRVDTLRALSDVKKELKAKIDLIR